MPHLHRVRLHLWSVAVVSLIVAAALAAVFSASASAAESSAFGELARFGSAFKGLESGTFTERVRAVGVDPKDNSVYVVDEPQEAEQAKKHLEPQAAYEECLEENEPAECEVPFGPITRHFRLQKFIASGAAHTFSAAATFTEVSPETSGSIGVQGIAIDSERERVYLLTTDGRESTLAIDHAEKPGASTSERGLVAAANLYAFSTKVSAGVLAPEGKGGTAVLAGPEVLDTQSVVKGQALLAPHGITVDPATHEVIILAHIDAKGEAVDYLHNAEDHYVLQRVTEAGALGARYVDTTNRFKSIPEFGALPSSPVVAGPSGSERVLVEDEGLVEVPDNFASTEAPKVFGPREVGKMIEEGSLNRAEDGGGLSAGPPTTAEPGGTIYRAAYIKNITSEGVGFGGVELLSAADGTPIGWTGGQQVIEEKKQKKKVQEDKCVIEPFAFSEPVYVAAGKEEKVFVLATEFMLEHEPEEEEGGGGAIGGTHFPGVIEFGPAGTGCPEASTPGIIAEANGTAFEETTPIKAGTKVALHASVEQADVLKSEWEVINKATKEVTKETNSAYQNEAAQLTRTFETAGEFEVVVKIHTDDLATPELKAVRGKVIVSAGKALVVKQPVNATVAAGENASFVAEASGALPMTAQWQVSTNKGVSWANDSADTAETKTVTPSNNTLSTLTVAHATQTESGNEYRVIFKDTTEATSAGATLTVSEGAVLPKVITQPQSASVTEPQKATFTSEASGTPAPTVQWQVSTNKGGSWANDTTDSGVTTDTLTIEPTSVSQSGNEYRAMFTNSAGKAESAGATLTVAAKPVAPVVTTQPSNQTVTAPVTATFTSAASGTPTPTVQWQVSTNKGVLWTNDTTDAGDTTGTLKVENTKGSETGNEYRAVFTNTGGKAESNGATLTANEAPLVTSQPAATAVTEGESASFKAEAAGSPTPTVQWQVSTNGGGSWSNDTTDTGNTTTTLTVEHATVAESGNEYRAVFTNTGGKVESNGAVLTVGTKPVAPVVTTQPSNQTVTAPATATFTSAASGTPTPTVQWQVSTNKGVLWTNDTTDAGDTTGTLKVENTKGSETGNEYRAVFTNTGGKAESNGATLTANEAAVVIAQPVAATVTEGANASFKAEAAGSPTPTVQWQLSTNGGGSWSNDTTDTGNTTTTLTIAATTVAESAHEYRAVFTNTSGPAVDSNSATLTVNAKAPEQHVTTPPVEPPSLIQSLPQQNVLGNTASKPPAVPDATLASTSITVSASGAFVLKVECPAGETTCEGTITLKTLSAVVARAQSAKSKAAILTLATASFSVPGGGSKSVSLHLSSKGRIVLGRSHTLRAKATLAAHDPAGGTHTTLSTVTLRAAKAKPKH